MLTMLPPPACRIAGTAALQQFQIPLTLTAIAASHSASSIASKRPPCRAPYSAALLIKPSSRPNAETAASTMARAEPASVTSSRADIPRPFSVETRSSVSAQSLTSAATIWAPAAARLRANSWPRPRAAPVIATTLSVTSIYGPSLAQNQRPAATRGRQRVFATPKPSSEHNVGARIDQVHLVQVGDQRHHLAGFTSGGRIHTAAHLGAVDDEIDHRLHTHRLDHVQLHGEVGSARRQLTALLDDVLGTQSEDQFLTGIWPVAGN